MTSANPQTPTSTQTTENFLETVARKGRLTSLYEAQDMAEIVFRTMRDLMDTSLIDRVTQDLNVPAYTGSNKVLDKTIADLWQDSNPVVRWLSRWRAPFSQTAPDGINDQLFFTRVQREGGMPRTTTSPTVVQAVFAATKPELSEACIQEIAQCLPGKVRTLWQSV